MKEASNNTVGIPCMRQWECFDLFGHKVCLTVMLQLRTLNYQALLAKYAVNGKPLRVYKLYS